MEDELEDWSHSFKVESEGKLKTFTISWFDMHFYLRIDNKWIGDVHWTFRDVGTGPITEELLPYIEIIKKLSARAVMMESIKDAIEEINEDSVESMIWEEPNKIIVNLVPGTSIIKNSGALIPEIENKTGGPVEISIGNDLHFRHIEMNVMP